MSASTAGKRAMAKAEKQAAMVAESFATITAAAEEEELSYVMTYLRSNRHLMYRFLKYIVEHSHKMYTHTHT